MTPGITCVKKRKEKGNTIGDKSKKGKSKRRSEKTDDMYEQKSAIKTKAKKSG